MSSFDNYSLYYDLLYEDKDYNQKINYLETLFKKYNSFPKSILTIGCGTGGHDFELLKKNYRITGIDLSSKMIQEANRKKNYYRFI